MRNKNEGEQESKSLVKTDAWLSFPSSDALGTESVKEPPGHSFCSQQVCRVSWMHFEKHCVQNRYYSGSCVFIRKGLKMTVHVGPWKGEVSHKTCFSARSLMPVTTEVGTCHVFSEVAPGGFYTPLPAPPHPMLLSPSLPVSTDFNPFVNVHYRKHLRIDLLLWGDSILGYDGWRTAKNIVANRCPVGLFNIMYLTGHSPTSMRRHWKNALPGSVWKFPVISEALESGHALGFAAALAGTIHRSSRLVLVVPFFIWGKKSKSFPFPKQYQSSQWWPSFNITSRSS